MLCLENEDSKIESWVYICFIVGLALTVFGPIFHYIAFVLALIFVVYKKLKYNVPLIPNFTIYGKLTVYCLATYFFYCCVTYFYHFSDWSIWARESSVPLEILFGVWLVAIMINTRAKRFTFLKVFFYVNMIAGIWLVSDQIGIAHFPSSTFFNHNMLGPYLYLIIPLHLSYIIQERMNSFIKAAFVALNVVFIIFSFSSITYATCFIEILIILIFTYKTKLLDVKVLVYAFLLCILSLFLINSYTHGNISPLISREFTQISSSSVRDLTSGRAEVWEFAIYSISQKPFLGWGKNNFDILHKQYIETFANSLKLASNYSFAHAHNLYLMIAFEIGIPGMLLFLLAMLIPVWSSLKMLFSHDNEEEIWPAIFLSMFLGQLIYSLAGEMILDMRRDVAVLLWIYWGIFSVYSQNKKRELL